MLLVVNNKGLACHAKADVRRWKLLVAIFLLPYFSIKLVELLEHGKDERLGHLIEEGIW